MVSSRIYKAAAELSRQGIPFALGMITSIKGSSPQKKGAKALFLADGRIIGTLGGGCLEAEIQDRARRALRTGEAARFDLLLDHDFGWDDGLICGGRVTGIILPRASEAREVWNGLAEHSLTVEWGIRRDYSIQTTNAEEGDDDWLYREKRRPPLALWIAGSGHVAQAVAPLALQVDFQVVIMDDRAALANTTCFPPSTEIRVDAWDRLLALPPPSQPTYGLIATRGHQHDARVLARWIRQPFVFLGMIGSHRKKRILTEQFITEGIATAEEMAAVASPVGLDIQAVSVPEIAVSVIAQLIAVRARQTRG